jgi:hypothetical protein
MNVCFCQQQPNPKNTPNAPGDLSRLPKIIAFGREELSHSFNRSDKQSFLVEKA